LTHTAIDIHGLSYSYEDQPILKHLDFHVQDGEFFIIIGPNGSGKTTLLKTICGIEPVHEDNVSLFGHLLSDYSKRDMAKVLSFVPQIIPADFPFTVLQTVLMGRFPHLGVLGVETELDLEIANQALTFSGVGHLSNRKLNELSGGERQRVFIARALCQEPRLLILDEPTASLDLSHQLRVMDLMEQLKQEKGLTIVMVSHDINLAAMYADRVLLMKEGEIVSIGTPWEVLTFQTLENAYECTILVDESPLGHYPRITLVPKKCLQLHAKKVKLRHENA
jgi:cobalamin transport system ATP-binding protein